MSVFFTIVAAQNTIRAFFVVMAQWAHWIEPNCTRPSFSSTRLFAHASKVVMAIKDNASNFVKTLKTFKEFARTDNDDGDDTTLCLKKGPPFNSL